jgi:hypothetical protein
MTKGQVLFDVINVGGINEPGLFHASTAFRIFGAHNRIQLFAQVFIRVAYSVEPFGFKFVASHPPSFLPDCRGDGFGKEADLFEHLDDGQADEFKVFHARDLVFNFLQSARCGRKSGRAMVSV